MGSNSITGEGDRIGLTKAQIAEAEAHQAAVARAELDEQELKELDRAEYYEEAPAAPPGRRSWLDRLLGRR